MRRAAVQRTATSAEHGKIAASVDQPALAAGFAQGFDSAIDGVPFRNAAEIQPNGDVRAYPQAPQ
jgi:hypothetical protein